MQPAVARDVCLMCGPRGARKIQNRVPSPLSTAVSVVGEQGEEVI